MAPAKRLNLSKSKAEESSASSSSEEEEERTATSEQEEQSDEEDSDEEFEIPSGFEPVKGSSAITREAVLSEDKELWFFKLPKHLDASALANVSFKVGKSGELGEAVASVTRDGKKFQLQHEDALLTQQLVNAFPLSSDRKKFSLAKPFSRVFSLVEDRTSSTLAVIPAAKSSKREAPVEEETEPVETSKSSKKSKKSKEGEDGEREKVKASKKAKSKK